MAEINITYKNKFRGTHLFMLYGDCSQGAECYYLLPGDRMFGIVHVLSNQLQILEGGCGC